LKLDYGQLRTPIILFRCEWMKRQDNRGNPTYIRDDAGFLVVNFRHKLARASDAFIFPSQATQVFFSEDVKKPGWKVVLWKEARPMREVIDTADVFITTTVESRGLVAPETVSRPPESTSLLGAIELSVE
jgi:archaeosine-15-forming tRNA-guanine transglycosylase